MIWLALGTYRGPMRPLPFVRYAGEILKAKNETELYRAYVTESLRLKGEGMYITNRYIDWIHPELESAADYDADQVVDSVIERAGLKVVG